MITAATTAAGFAFLVSLAMTPLVRRLALAFGATDIPDARRVHSRVTARAGGLAVIFAAAVALFMSGRVPSAIGPGVIAGGALLLVTGLIDDVISIRAQRKLFVQIAAAMLAVHGGLRFHFFGTTPGLGLGLVDACLTGAWIVLITNAFNLSDGLDGLASGIAILAFLALTAVGVRAHDPATTTTALVLVGALLGFLPYNFNPASIFLGDTGSLVIGYALAILPVVGTHGTPVPFLAALLLVALPATDTSIAISRRFLSRCLRSWSEGPFVGGLVEGLRNTVNPDRRHIHHRLLDLGLSQRRAVMLLYLAATSTSGLAYLVAGVPSWPIDLFAIGLGITVIALVHALGFDELQPARSGLVLPILRRVARHGWLVVTADVGLVAATYASALALTSHPAGPKIELIAALALVVGAQILVFALLGVYRTAWWVTEVSGFGLLLRACGAGTVAAYIGLRVLDLPTGESVVLVHYFLLLTAVTLMRFSHVLLANAVRDHADAERALIYGTATEGRQALRRLRRNGARTLDPVGFIELRPRLQGRELARVPVIGTLDRLPGLVRERQVRHLVIADPALRGEALDWVRAVCRQLDVQLHRYVERLVPYDGRVATPTEMAHFRPAPALWLQSPGGADHEVTGSSNGNGNGHAPVLANRNATAPGDGHRPRD